MLFTRLKCLFFEKIVHFTFNILTYGLVLRGLFLHFKLALLLTLCFCTPRIRSTDANSRVLIVIKYVTAINVKQSKFHVKRKEKFSYILSKTVTAVKNLTRIKNIKIITTAVKIHYIRSVWKLLYQYILFILYCFSKTYFFLIIYSFIHCTVFPNREKTAKIRKVKIPLHIWYRWKQHSFLNSKNQKNKNYRCP